MAAGQLEPRPTGVIVFQQLSGKLDPGSMSVVGSGPLAAENQVIELSFAHGTAEFRKGKKRDQHYEDHDPD